MKAFQTRAVPGAAADDAEAKQNEQPYPHSEQVIYQKTRSYDDFATFSAKKWLSCGKDFSFMLSAFCGTFFHLLLREVDFF